MIDIMFYEVFKEEKEAIKEYLPKEIKADFTECTIQEYHNRQRPAPVISIRTQSKIPKEWASELKGILTRSTGYEHLSNYVIDMGFNIPCGYLPNYCSRAVAEHSILLLMALLRKLKVQQRNFNSFYRNDITGGECKEKKLLVVGVGKIGSEIVNIGQGLGMNVEGVDIDPKTRDIKYVSLEEGISWADVIICALPLTDKTRGMMNYQLFQNAKEGVVFINISRGEISPTEDLKRLIDEQKIGFLGLDVYENETTLAEYLRGGKKEITIKEKMIEEMKERENVIFTPHNAFNTQEAVVRKAKETIENIIYFEKKGHFKNSI